jgi:hypothetical protein
MRALQSDGIHQRGCTLGGELGAGSRVFGPPPRPAYLEDAFWGRGIAVVRTARSRGGNQLRDKSLSDGPHLDPCGNESLGRFLAQFRLELDPVRS